MGLFNKKKGVDINGSAYKAGGKVAEKMFDIERKFGQYLNDAQHRVGFKARNVLMLILAIIFLLFLFMQ